MKRMRARALYVAFDVYPRPKGSSSHIASMVSALEQEYGAVTVLCLGSPELPLLEQTGGVVIHRYPAGQRELLARATGFAQFVSLHTSRLRGELELIVFRDPWGGLPATAAAEGIPAIFEVNALPSWELGYSRPGFTQSPALMTKLGDMERRCLREASAVLCVSGVTQRALVMEGVAAGRVTVVPNAASPIYFGGGACSLPALAEGEWCAYVGGLQPWQGVEFLLDSFAWTSRGRLLIVHSGNRSTRELERRIARHGLDGRVLLHPPLAPAELAGVFGRLRFTVAPLEETARNTWQGCCPVKIVESMAAGTPVLAADLAVSRELIRHGENGWLASPGDRRAWALAMDRLFADDGLRARLAIGARASARPQVAAHEELRKLFRETASGCAQLR
jgi:glycosyltransferase involved in cell wall biosynthesis